MQIHFPLAVYIFRLNYGSLVNHLFQGRRRDILRNANFLFSSLHSAASSFTFI